MACHWNLANGASLGSERESYDVERTLDSERSDRKQWRRFSHQITLAGPMSYARGHPREEDTTPNLRYLCMFAYICVTYLFMRLSRVCRQSRPQASEAGEWVRAAGTLQWIHPTPYVVEGRRSHPAYL